MSNKKVFEFSGQNVTVSWDSRLCIHIGECAQSEGDLFVMGREPWCVPDSSSPEQVAEVCERCPSGALSYQNQSGNPEQAPTENSVHVTYNGPVYVYGDLDIADIPDDMPGVRFRAALCRCGHSKNKPFCDNSHLKSDFEDYGAVGEKGPGISSASGKLAIKPLKDGPVLIDGNVTLYSASGRKAWQGNNLALCRCGRSANKPFCDGSHKKIGFKSD